MIQIYVQIVVVSSEKRQVDLVRLWVVVIIRIADIPIKLMERIIRNGIKS
jgi:hypothetical protein